MKKYFIFGDIDGRMEHYGEYDSTDKERYVIAYGHLLFEDISLVDLAKKINKPVYSLSNKVSSITDSFEEGYNDYLSLNGKDYEALKEGSITVIREIKNLKLNHYYEIDKDRLENTFKDVSEFADKIGAENENN